MTQAHWNLSTRTRKTAGILMVSGCLALVIAALGWWEAKAQTMPPDPQSSCKVAPTVFAGWFQSGTPAADGVVNPANSITFPNTPNCSFYQWSKQMFLWLTSPAPSIYGGGARIFDSPTFYDVSPADPTTGKRTFIPHVPGRLRFFNLRAAKVGPNGLPVLFDQRGRLVEVHPPKLSANGKPLVLNRAGREVEVQQITVQNRKAVFLGAANKPIVAARPILPQKKPTIQQRKILPKKVAAMTPVQRFIVNGRPVFIDPFGNVIDTEEGQADGGVLITQKNSLVYYATMVNDVYAYFLTGVKDGAIPPPGGNVANAVFPTSQADLTTISTFASAHGHTFPDGIALAIEIKTSWVESSGVPDKTQYILMNATVPTYDTSNPNQWVQNGEKNVELALTGMHVVGSTNGHAEMIWATFEHFGNAPNGTYQYTSLTGTKTINQNTAGAWLFTANGSGGPFNCMRQNEPFGTTNIVPTGNCQPAGIGPSDTIRWKAFGGAFNQTPNPLDPDTAASNSEIISINNTTQVPGNDVRNQYFMTGATWTIGGAAPTGIFPNGNEVGTSRLANTTMETYGQGTANTVTNFDTNCFSCHVTNKVKVSHVFCDPAHGCSAGLQPLF